MLRFHVLVASAAVCDALLARRRRLVVSSGTLYLLCRRGLETIGSLARNFLTWPAIVLCFLQSDSLKSAPMTSLPASHWVSVKMNGCYTLRGQKRGVDASCTRPPLYLRILLQQYQQTCAQASCTLLRHDLVSRSETQLLLNRRVSFRLLTCSAGCFATIVCVI